MNYAVILTGGKQYQVAEGQLLTVEKLAGEVGSDVVFDKVLLFVQDEKAQIGKPYLSGVTVSGKIEAQARGEKLRVSQFKAKARYRKVRGHRQELTQVKIGKIVAKAQKAEAKKEE